MNASHQFLRFAAGAGLALGAGMPAAGVLGGLLGVSSTRGSMALASGILTGLLLLLSAWLLRRDGATASSLGLPTNWLRVRELVTGATLSALLFLGVAGVQSMIVGGSWRLAGASGVQAALVGLALTASMVLFEELLFRGVGLRYLRAMYGDWAAIALSALVFGGYHLLGSQDWAIGAVYGFVMPMIGGVVFGWAALRSGGLALPIGLHLGGNWVQAYVAGFSVNGQSGTALFNIPISPEDFLQLAAPDFLPRLPYLAAVGLMSLGIWIMVRRQRALSA